MIPIWLGNEGSGFLFAGSNSPAFSNLDLSFSNVSNNSPKPGDRIQQQAIHLHHMQDRLSKTWAHQVEKKHWKLLELSQRLSAASPGLSQLVVQQKERASRFQYAYLRYFEALSVRLQHLQTQLSHLNPQAVLERGYSITYSMQDMIIRDSKQLNPDERIQVKFAHGMCEADVTKTKNS